MNQCERRRAGEKERDGAGDARGDVVTGERTEGNRRPRGGPRGGRGQVVEEERRWGIGAADASSPSPLALFLRPQFPFECLTGGVLSRLIESPDCFVFLNPLLCPVCSLLPEVPSYSPISLANGKNSLLKLFF